MKGQVAVEYLMMIGIVLVIIIPLSAYAWQQNEITTRIRQAQIAADTIANTADNLYAQGTGAKTSINIYLPNGYVAEESSLNEKIILLKIYTPAGYSDIISTTKGNISGMIPAESGYKILELEMKENFVSVTAK